METVVESRADWTVLEGLLRTHTVQLVIVYLASPGSKYTLYGSQVNFTVEIRLTIFQMSFSGGNRIQLTNMRYELGI